MRKFQVTLITLVFVVGGCNHNRQMPSQSGNTTANSATYQSELPVNYKEFIIGSWDSRDLETIKCGMTLTFKADKTAIIEYGSEGRRFTTRYDIVKTNVIKMKEFPEDLIIDRKGDDRIHFGLRGNRLREDILIVYECDFDRRRE